MERLGMRIATGMVTACVVLGAAGLIRGHAEVSPLQSLGNAAAFVSGSVLTRMYMEIPGAEPGLGETLLESRKGAASAEGTSSGEPVEPTASSGAETPSAASDAESEPAGDSEAVPAGAPASPSPSEDKPPAEKPTSAAAKPETDRKLAFIYHSHNRESWLPELKGTSKDQPNEAFDADVNVSMLGARLQKKLEEFGVGAVHSGTDYNTAVKNFNYNYSYKYSKTTVKEALAVHDDLVYLLDIHRDSSRREQTTVEIDGKAYAKMYFIVGQGNPNWKDNEALAKRIHEKMEKKLPGVSKGILTKGTRHGHGEYNQSLSKGSVLIEIGGVDNTLEESNRTIDALASIIAELAKDAVKVDAGAASEQPEKT
ncbi:stage II sporulation protein P [Paenibacillus antri]|uniref:Stage II sporulation protein P n=1 Tax=Paenibacillus antri TaxID=2582848 RepID=A0A5R9GJY4_9BACL|nr:stage II sporulation protein P [Paenibacillus antri]TLS53738.1 stage II sporulation protein P [Paenibacillus antri]